MPELPEVETIVRGLNKKLLGKKITTVSVYEEKSLLQGKDFFIKNIENFSIVQIFRRGKLLIFELSNKMTLLFHLKMTGRLVIAEDISVKKENTQQARIQFVLEDGQELLFSDQRKFGYAGLFTKESLKDFSFLKTLGKEPLTISLTEFNDALKKTNTGIKNFLLSQKYLAGIGNIYADESLFHAKIHPNRKTAELSNKEKEALLLSIQKVLLKAIAENGSSIRDYRDAGGNVGAFQNFFYVYARKNESCKVCTTMLSTEKIAGRTSTFCPSCQK